MDDHNHIHIHMLLTSVLTVCWLLLITLPQSRSQPSSYDYSVCKELSYNCGNLSNISYPFWGQNQSPQCGGGDPFQLSCHDDNTTSIRIGSQNFTVKEINITAQTMRMVRADLALNVCSPQFEDTYLNSTLFRYASSVYIITIFYNCDSISDVDRPRVGVFECEHGAVAFYDVLGAYDESHKACEKHVQVPVDQHVPYDINGGRDFLDQVFSRGFLVNYTVLDTIHYTPSPTPTTLPPSPSSSNSLDQSHHATIAGNKWNKRRKLIIIGVTGAAIAGMLICIAILCLRYKSSIWQEHFGLTSKSNQNIEAFLENDGALIPKRYKLSHVKKMTTNLKVKLGQGGFGAVYKGKLSNGSPVAVKILNASKKNGEEFINEVASISRTSHINVVTLLGFCLEGRKRALIYEFMPNGSLDKFIYSKGLETVMPLSWDIIYQISMGIAQGLEYLHKGCNTRILHFDIKPHNILLDENFCPKISDFGLAKLCPRNESIISISDARGTMGYVAPEMWSRHLGGVSHKSDVYSYGMMLLEMVGGRKNINAEASHTSEIYFPHWAYNKLELDNDLRSDMVMTTEENEIAKRLAIVGLWCTQTFPNDRPTMSRVIDMLEGSMNSLAIPPKPLLSSPTTLAPESSIS